MYTNGINHWTTRIPNSGVDLPFHISSITLSDDKRTIIAYYTVIGNGSQYFIKTFR